MDFWRLINPENFIQTSLMGHHNHWLCLIAVFLAVLASYVLLPVTNRYHSTHGSYRLFWLVAGSITMGTGIWAMHFTGMLAFTLPVPIYYDITITVISIFPAIIASGSCIILSDPNKQSNLRLHLTALLMAVGIGTMHYTGMEAIVVTADMYYVPLFFFMSILAAYLLALIGLYSYSKLTTNNKMPALVGKSVGSIILGMAVSSMHFIAMRATYFQANESSIFQGHAIPPYSLVGGIIAATVVMFGFVLLGIVIDKRMSNMADSLKKSEVKFQRLAETTQTAIFTFDQDKIIYSNPALSNITEYDLSVISQLSLLEIFGNEVYSYIEEMLHSHTPFGQAYYEQFEISTALGNKKWLHFSFTLAEFDDDAIGLASACDISDQKDAEMNMRRLAYSDQLTKLANRSMFMDRLEHHLELLKRRDDGHVSCVMLLDLDNFKSINDTLGHLMGDSLLNEIAIRLKRFGRSCDTIARLGGDEFVLLLEELDDTLDESIIAERLLKSLLEPYVLGGRDLDVNVSIGIVELSSEQYQKPDEVLHDADLALYRAKKNGKACWVLFNEELDAKAKRARQLLPELKSAIQNNSLELHYQPIVDAGNHRIEGAEALIRWKREGGESVSPAEFIPLAEQSNLIADLGLWVIKTASHAISDLNRHFGHEEFYVSINIASVSFNDNRFHESLRAFTEEYRINPKQLKLELTERMLVKNADIIIGQLNDIVSEGYEIMLDDFGTGYSSLSYLHKMPIGTLKIDSSFVADLDKESSSKPIVNSIISLAKNLDMKIISEGVETEYQSNLLASMGSDKLQGYLYSKALNFESLVDYIQDVAQENEGSDVASNFQACNPI